MNSSFDSPETLASDEVGALCNEALKLAEAEVGVRVLLEVNYNTVSIWVATIPDILHKGIGVTPKEALDSLIKQLRHGCTSLLS
jgi:hypothetical protein